MKFISWNVNGIRSAWNHGLPTFFELHQADIYAFQETRTDEAFSSVELEGYYPYWSFCSRRGYSGTMCLTREKPLNVYFDMFDASFDTEGRIITLEFEHFYFVNCYVPNSQFSEERHDYRTAWDEHFVRFLAWLRNRKPTVVCGDFNATPSDADMWVTQYEEGFQTTERESFLTILDNGFIDTFRYLYPEETNAYTFWSSRRYERSDNRGWRLDYFLISDMVKDKVVDSVILKNVYGSDHCPIVLVVNFSHIKVDKTSFLLHEQQRLHRNVLYNHIDRQGLAKLWNTYDTEQAKKNLADMQMALAKVAYTRDAEAITAWQKRIVSSLDAKVLAVQHVCNSASGAGVDKIKWKTPDDKMLAAFSLNSKHYEAQPSRLLLLRSKNGKQRRIHVETYFDRAMQCLYAYALDPLAESWGDRMSFAFRKGRSAYDLNEHLQHALTGKDAPGWLFIADVCKCYENISHAWIMDNIPMSKTVLYQFLKAGYVFGNELYPQDTGIGIGKSMAPIIANMVLDGLQDYVYARIHPDGNIDHGNGGMFRYADDIIFMARTEETAWKIKAYATEFLAERGLKLSYQKSKVMPVEEGFTFMSRTYKKVGTIMTAQPSNQGMERFMESMKDTIVNYDGSQKSLIAKVNRKIDGWVTYHKVSDAEEAFKQMDVYITGLLLQLCQVKHPKWDKERIFKKYWNVDREGRHYYALPKNPDVRVKFLADTVYMDYRAINTKANPYINTEYFELRRQTRAINSVSGIYKEIWQRQDGRCYYCGLKILRDEEKTLMEIDSIKKRYIDRVVYVHCRCLSCTFDYVDDVHTPSSLDDVRRLLTELDKR